VVRGGEQGRRRKKSSRGGGVWARVVLTIRVAEEEEIIHLQEHMQ
jgi:hypothetical protein